MANRKEIEKKVIEILADRLSISKEKIVSTSLLKEDLGMDSFMAVEVLFELKGYFDIVIKDEEFKNIKTIEDIVTCLHKNKKNK